MTLSLSKVTIKDVGYTKRNKRCIPKEGMPHAHKACQKKKERKDSPCPKINKGERWIMQGNPLATKKLFHTLAPLDQIV